MEFIGGDSLVANGDRATYRPGRKPPVSGPIATLLPIGIIIGLPAPYHPNITDQEYLEPPQ
jgi:hypothetical protein